MLAAIRAYIAALADDARNFGMQPVAIGLAVPGLVTPTHAIFSAAFGWHDVTADAFNPLDLPLALGHDVRSAAEAERAHGAAGGAEATLFLPIGTGIAGAITLGDRGGRAPESGDVSGGAVYGGAAGWAGQIGHMPVYPDGRPCGCGQRGCLSRYASASAIAAQCGETSAEAVVARMAAGDETATRVWHEAADALALALATYTLIFDPALVVVGGGLSLAGETLLTPVRDRLTRRLAFRPPPRLELSRLGCTRV